MCFWIFKKSYYLPLKDGNFRGFAFIGFKTDEEAEAAKKYFQGTYIGAAKIQVEDCAALGDVSKKSKKKNEVRNNELTYAIKSVSERLVFPVFCYSREGW